MGKRSQVHGLVKECSDSYNHSVHSNAGVAKTMAHTPSAERSSAPRIRSPARTPRSTQQWCPVAPWLRAAHHVQLERTVGGSVSPVWSGLDKRLPQLRRLRLCLAIQSTAHNQRCFNSQALISSHTTSPFVSRTLESSCEALWTPAPWAPVA